MLTSSVATSFPIRVSYSSFFSFAEKTSRASLAWADAHYAEAFALCREHSSELADSAIESHIGLYVNEYTRDLGPQGQAAVDYFFAHQRGK